MKVLIEILTNSLMYNQSDKNKKSMCSRLDRLCSDINCNKCPFNDDKSVYELISKLEKLSNK